MSVFWQTENGGAVNSDHVVRIVKSVRKTENGTSVEILAKTKDGGTVDLSAATVDNLIKQTLPVVPALPGFYVLSVYMEGNEHWVSRDVIVAWRVGEFSPIPVTLDDYLPEDYAVLGADGKITRPYLDSFASEEEWVKHMIEHERSKAAKKEDAA